MKALIKKLGFDRQLVTGIKKMNGSHDYLYALLNEGKITLAEYMVAVKQ